MLGVSMTLIRRWLLSALLVACGGTGGDDGGPTPEDGGADARVTDADGGRRDAATTDGGRQDAGPPPPDAGPVPPEIHLGTGQLEFEPLPEDGTLELRRGGQGGVHLDVAVRIEGVAIERVTLRYFGYDAESGLRIFLPTARSLGPTDVVADDGGLVRAGDRLVLDETRVEQTEIVGVPVRIDVVLETPEGDLMDSAVVTVVDEV